MSMRLAAALLGSESAARVLLALTASEPAYCSEIAARFGCTPRMVQLQLDKFEAAGLLVSRTVGRTRLYSWNPGNAAVADVKTLMKTLTERLSREERERLTRPERKRPRRRGKPLTL